MNLVADLLFLASALALAYAALLGAARLPIFPLRELAVTTPLTQVTAMQIEYAAQTAVLGNFFTVNLEAVRAAFAKLPWVRKVSVRRRWPDGLELAVEEYVAAARWRHADGAEARLVSREGEVFAASSNAGLPVFVGPEGSAPQILARARELTEWLAPLGRAPQVVALSPRQAWQVRLDDEALLELGQDQAKSTVRDRVLRFVGAYRAAQERLGARAELVDLRYPNGFAARLARSGSGGQ